MSSKCLRTIDSTFKQSNKTCFYNKAKKIKCLFQVSRPYLAFCPNPKYFFKLWAKHQICWKMVQNVVKNAFSIKYFDKIKYYADRPYLVFSELKPETHIYFFFCLNVWLSGLWLAAKTITPDFLTLIIINRLKTTSKCTELAIKKRSSSKTIICHRTCSSKWLISQCLKMGFWSDMIFFPTM